MNDLLLTNDFPPNRPGGISDYLCNLAVHWKDMVVLTDAAPGAYTGDRDCGCKVYRTMLGKAVAAIPFGCIYSLFLIYKYKIGIIHCGNASPFRWVAFALSLLTGKPYVIYYYGNDLLRFARKTRRSRVRRTLAKAVLTRAAAIVTISRYTRDLFTANFPYVNKERILLVVPGIGAQFLNRSVEEPRFVPGETARMVSVGRLNERKGFDRVIESLPLIAARGFKVSYTIAGKGDQRPFRELAKKTGVENCVTFMGYLQSQDDVIRQIERSHLFIMPSRVIGDSEVEGFGIVFLQAAALKRPSIGSATGGIPDAVDDGCTGLLVKNPESPEEIAEVVVSLLRTPERLSILGKAGYERVNREFDWRIICRRFKGQLRTLIHE